jgi:hypothetical protein
VTADEWPQERQKMHNEKGDFHLPKGSLYSPFPIPAIKFLVRKGHRPASRILYAIVLHKGKSKSAIFPSYETLALYAYVGENSIRGCLDTLEKYEFIRVTKTRSGKKSQNRYEILDKAYQLDLNPKSKAVKPLEVMICNTCWKDISGPDFLVRKFETWEGQRKEELRHKDCPENNGYSILIPVTETSRRTQQWNLSILEIDKAARRVT